MFLFQVVLASSSVLGLTVNHSQFLCTRVNEPLMTTVAGQMKNLVSTIVGAFAFADYSFNIINVVGVAMSMSGELVPHSCCLRSLPQCCEFGAQAPLARLTPTQFLHLNLGLWGECCCWGSVILFPSCLLALRASHELPVSGVAHY